MKSKKKNFVDALSKRKKTIMDDFVSNIQATQIGNSSSGINNNLDQYMSYRKKRKWILASSLFFLLFVMVLFFVGFDADTNSKLILSDTSMDWQSLQNIQSKNVLYQKKPIFVYFFLAVFHHIYNLD